MNHTKSFLVFVKLIFISYFGSPENFEKVICVDVPLSPSNIYCLFDLNNKHQPEILTVRHKLHQLLLIITLEILTVNYC